MSVASAEVCHTHAVRQGLHHSGSAKGQHGQSQQPTKAKPGLQVSQRCAGQVRPQGRREVGGSGQEEDWPMDGMGWPGERGGVESGIYARGCLG